MPIQQVSMLGIEAEFLPLSDDKPVNCATFGIPHDDFQAFAEVRGLPGTTLPLIVGNFAVEFHYVKRMCVDHRLKPFYEEYTWPKELYQFYADLMDKETSYAQEKWKNIYNLEKQEDKSRRGGGLHIHFSATLGQTKSQQGWSILTPPVIERLVRKMDEQFDRAIKKCDGPYRVPGMWEEKPWGFEYRSLPFNQWAIDNIIEIAEFALEALQEAVNTRVVVQNSNEPKPKVPAIVESEDEGERIVGL
jgi:hypothetical protein